MISSILMIRNPIAENDTSWLIISFRSSLSLFAFGIPVITLRNEFSISAFLKSRTRFIKNAKNKPIPVNRMIRRIQPFGSCMTPSCTLTGISGPNARPPSKAAATAPFIAKKNAAKIMGMYIGAKWRPSCRLSDRQRMIRQKSETERDNLQRPVCQIPKVFRQTCFHQYRSPHQGLPFASSEKCRRAQQRGILYAGNRVYRFRQAGSAPRPYFSPST